VISLYFFINLFFSFFSNFLKFLFLLCACVVFCVLSVSFYMFCVAAAMAK